MFFGTALSSLINFFLSTQGQISAVGTIISAGYGFICGAYMPISSFSDGLQTVISLLPGTYGTSLFRNHAMSGALKALGEEGIPGEVIDGLRDAVDCNIYFFGDQITNTVKMTVLTGSVIVFITAYVLLNVLARKKEK